MRTEIPRAFFALFPLTVIACEGGGFETVEATSPSTTDAPECAPGGERFYQHPLQHTKPLSDGRLPFVEAKRSERGNAYALGEGFSAGKEGEPGARDFSGVVELESRPMTKKERSTKPARVRSARPFDKLDVSLRARVEELGRSAGGLLPVQIHMKQGREGTLTQRINRAIAEGRIQTTAERAEVREQELAAFARELEPQQRELARLIAQAGGEVRYRCRYAACASAELGVEQILALSKSESVQRIGLLEDSKADSLDGEEKAQVYQTRLFWDETFDDLGVTYQFDGNNGQGTDIRVAVLDDQGFRTTHVAFREDTGGSRIDGLWDCRTPPCVSVPSFAGISAHGTAVLGTVLGDYRDGQDPAQVSVSARERRSAPGGEAKAYVYWAQRQQSDQQAVYDEILNRNPAPHLLVSSNSVGAATDCSGEDTKAVGADGVYEAGIAYFKSANQAGGSSAECTVGPPGEAIGVFTVAGFDDPNTDFCASRAALVEADSGWGGSISDFDEGKFRSIIALTGSYQGASVPWFTSDTAVATFTGTSHANPSVASAAINLIDQMKNYQNTNFIDDPGVLYAWMLNMGDRRSQSGTRLTSRFDHRTGAGNIKMRFLGAPGLDGPYYWYHYEACIEDGEVYTINVNDGLPLSSDVDSLRAVAWWYDRRIESGTDIDDIDLRLATTAGATLRNSNDRYDNKERVYHSAVGGQAVKLEVTGFDVTSDVEGCGTNSMRVFITVIAEDDDRDDADGPDYDAVSCEGVETL